MKKTLFVALMVIAGIAHAGQSEFSTSKGIRLGMTVAEAQAITGSMVEDFSAKLKANSLPECSYKVPYEVRDASPVCNPKKPAESWSDIKGITIGGIGFSSLDYKSELTTLNSFPRAEQMEEALDVFTKGYGKPKSFKRFKSQTKGGLELDNFTATWAVKDVVITMYKHIDRDTGSISVETLASIQAKLAQDNSKKSKAEKDF